MKVGSDARWEGEDRWGTQYGKKKIDRGDEEWEEEGRWRTQDGNKKIDGGDAELEEKMDGGRRMGRRRYMEETKNGKKKIDG
jgi:hypothetical protein